MVRALGSRPRQGACLGAIAAILLPLLATSPAAAGAMPGSLDPSFGNDGRITRAVSRTTTGIRLAVGPGQKVVVGAGQVILRYRGDGVLDRSFGHSGRVRIEEVPGAQLDPVDIAVDSRGRVLIAATTSRAPAVQCASPGLPPVSQEFRPSSLTVIRLTSHGRQDPSFGKDGVVSTDFDFPPPTGNNGTFECDASSVQATGLAIDAQDRPVLTGMYVKEPGACKAAYPMSGFHQAFVARLTVDGLPDPALHRTGVRVDADLLGADEPAIDARNNLTYGGTVGAECTPFNGYTYFAVGRLGATGNPSLDFGPTGYKALGKPLPFEGLPAYFFFSGPIAVDHSGDILLLQERANPPATRVVRLNSNGDLDPRFGRRGNATVQTRSRTAFNAIEVDDQGRVVLAGSHADRQFALLRLHANGARDRDFGSRGVALTGFGSSTKASSEQLLIDGHDRILLAGTIGSRHLPTGIGFGLARYTSGH